MTTLTSKSRVLLPVNELLAGQGKASLRPARLALARMPLRATARPVAKPGRLSPVSETFGEKLLFGVLALAALAGVVYGVWTMTTCVQNWPLLNAWVGRILGA